MIDVQVVALVIIRLFPLMTLRDFFCLSQGGLFHQLLLMRTMICWQTRWVSVTKTLSL